MNNAIMDMVDKANQKEEGSVPQFEIGDTVDVHSKILEGNKERIQVFTGVVIGRSGKGAQEMFAASWLAKAWSVSSLFTAPASKRSKSNAAVSPVAPSFTSSAIASARQFV